ncbi:hypothetical protein FBULB1_9230 [Fusarium bulbicola]|nr:hypothetical protein FBULB1_9230 [Fusarium bulbicola]
MVVLTHDVDPQGDLIVVLQEPNSANLVPEVLIRKPGTVKGKPEWQSDQDALNHPKAEPVFTACDGSGKQLFTARNIVNSQPESDKEPVEVHFRVSSQHMKLASPFFEKMLNGPWRESTFARSPYTPASRAGSASLEPPADIFDDTFEKVSPTHRQLQLLVPYSLREQSGARHCTAFRFPLTYGKCCILWLFIAWVFGWDDAFSNLASFVIEHGEGLDLVNSNELPVITMLEKLDAKRQEYISKIITRLDELTEELLDGRAGCGHRCSSMLLGSLLRERRDLPLLDPELQSPYTGYSVYKYVKKIYAFRVMDWGYMGWVGSATAHRCTILTTMGPLLKTIDDDIKNFNIS